MSNLDARLKIEIREVIKSIQQDLQVTAILVTHDQEEAMALADEIAILDGGRIQQFATPDTLYEQPANLFVANFMGNPPMNFLEGTMIDRDHFAIAGVTLACAMPLKEDASGKQIKIGVRPHMLSLATERDERHVVPMRMHIVENLGKELLVYGEVGDAEVRVSYPDKGMYAALKQKAQEKGDVYLSLGGKYNVFLLPDGCNIVDFEALDR